jgi:Bacterial membrane protein YfhO
VPSRLSRNQAAFLEALLVVAAFTGVAIFATWPLAIHPLGGFYGFGNDNWGGIPYLGWLHDAYLGPGDPSFDPQLQAPFGLEIPEHAIQPMDRLFALVLGGFGQGLGTYNAQIFLSFVLAGCTMYLLARYVTRSKLAALVAGFAFTFSPFHLALSMQYNALASIQWIPLFILALIVLLRRGRRRDAVLTGAAFALVLATSYYYAWFLVWFTALVVAYLAVAAVFRRKANWPLFWLAISRAAIAGAVAVAISAPFLVTSARGAAEAGSATLNHPLTEAVRYSARPWMLFLPPEDNPVVGDRVQPWVQQHLFDSPVYEQSIYLGYTLLLLAAIGLWPSRRGLPDRMRFSRRIALVGLAAALLIIVGPYIPFEKSYWRLWSTPSATAHVPSLGWLMFHISPVFRFFVRAFVLVSACLVVLAAIGFARLERGSRMTPARRGALAALVLALIAVEFSNAPPHVWFSARAPDWVAAVRRLPARATVVEYPISPAFSSRSLYYMFWQTKYGRANTNPAVDPEAQAFAGQIGQPDDPAAGAALHSAGVDYAVVHTRLPPQTTVPFQPQLPDDSMSRNAGALNPWFQTVAKMPDAVIYRVRDAPAASRGAVVRPGAGFGASEPEGGSTARWLMEQSGDLILFVTGSRRRVGLVITLSSLAQPRRVSLSRGVHQLASFDVPPGSYTTRRIPVGVLPAGRYDLTLASRPGPQSIQEATGLPDARSVSIRLREPVLVR